ncbi:MAG TPA: glycosyltransferase family 4 protein [Candidatus Angelobacter sp.]|nr:glycosyltransferase family 4 protein [Candidatus Angelobacter sp.]
MKAKELKVLQLISSGGYYGAENMLLNLCASQDEAGCRNSLLLFYNVHVPNVEFYERARRRGLSVRMVHCRGRADWRAVRQIKEYIAEDAIDVVHTHGYKADLYGYFAARGARRPIVATCHNWVGGTAALGIYNRLDRMVLKRFSAVAAVSETVRERLLQSGIAAEKIKVIANGIDVAAFERAQALVELRGDATKVIGVVARLDLQKGFEHLLAAVRELGASLSGLKVIIVGEGPDRAAITDMIEREGLRESVVLAGQRSDMASVYASIDIFVLPSLNEGLPMTLLEAMAASRPVVATRVGAIPKVIEDGKTGLLVNPGDAGGLKDALARLLADGALSERLAAQGHEWVARHYTAAAMARQYRAMYDAVLGRPLVATAKAQSFGDSGAGARSA